MATLLLVEDSITVQKMVMQVLGARHQLICVATGADVPEAFAKHNFDLILLDVILPDTDGFNLCMNFRNDPKTREIPIIFLTGQKEVSHEVTGFSLGADDYIIKPFNPVTLLARVESKLERRNARKQADEMLTKGNIRLNKPFQKAFYLNGDQESDLGLSALEFKLLYYFISNEERVLSREKLLNAIWGENVAVLDRTVDKHVSSLRKKLSIAGCQIEAVPGEGYRFIHQKGQGQRTASKQKVA